MKKIAVIGAGVYGAALGDILSEKGFLVLYYDPKLPDTNIVSVVDRANYILLAAPSTSVDHILPSLPKDIPLIVATKGILSKDTFSEFSDVMLISGPGYAVDIVKKKKTKLTATDSRVIELFSTNYLSFDYTDDFQGVLLSGSLKNVYAIGAGILSLEYGSPEWRKYISDAYLEFKSILKINDCDPHTADLSCGIGDLKLTCDTPSRNYQFGQDLANNKKTSTHETVEGLSTARSIHDGKLALPEDADILKNIVKRVIDGTK